MRKKSIFGLALLLFILISGAGFFYFSNLSKTIVTLNKSKLTESEARNIAQKSCIKGGESLSIGVYNENSMTWWFDANLNASKEGCNPACVVSESTKTAEINWRCTGLLTDKINKETLCSDDQRGADLCAEIYEPVCATVDVQCPKAPCDPVIQTFSNSCVACRNPLVESYTSGACGSTSDAGSVIQKLFAEKYPKYSDTISINIGQESKDHVRGSISFEPGAPGGIFLAAKIEGEWKIIFDGNGNIPCNLSKYGFPSNMLSDCAD